MSIRYDLIAVPELGGTLCVLPARGLAPPAMLFIPNAQSQADTLAVALGEVFNPFTTRLCDAMANLTGLTAEVHANSAVTASAVSLVNLLADQVKSGSTDQATVDAAVAELKANNKKLSDVVTANTPNKG